MSLVIDAAAQSILFRDARSANAFTDEPVTVIRCAPSTTS